MPISTKSCKICFNMNHTFCTKTKKKIIIINLNDHYNKHLICFDLQKDIKNEHRHSKEDYQ